MARINVTITSGEIIVVERDRGESGFSGRSGYSGFSGANPGTSGYSGYSGFSGRIGTSGFSGDGTSGFSGRSGYSGFSGVGTSGYSGYSGVGTSGYSGYSGAGASGYSGYSGISGYSGFSGPSGYSGFTGVSGYSGFTGISGYSGYSGSGVSGYSGYSGLGTSGYSGYSGAAGTVSSVTGTANQVTASPTTGAVVLTTPQNTHTAATPQFAKLGLGAAADATHPLLATTSATAAAGGKFTNTSNNSAAYASLQLINDAGTLFAFFLNSSANANYGGANTVTLDMASNFNMAFATNDLVRMTLTNVGNLKIAGTAVRATTEGTNHIDIFNGTAPVGTLANGISLYSAAGEFWVRDAGGTATQLSPHDKDNKWIFNSERGGKRLFIEVEKLLRLLNDYFGTDLIHEDDE